MHFPVVAELHNSVKVPSCSILPDFQGGDAFLFEASQASPAYPSDKSCIKMKKLHSISEITGKNPSKCHFILLKSHMDRQGNKPGYPG